MSEVIGSGTIKVRADSTELKAGIEEAKRSVRSLGADLGASARTGSADAQRSIQAYVSTIQRAADNVGKTAGEIKLMELAQRGATAEQLAAVTASQKVIEGYKAQQREAKAAAAAATELEQRQASFISALREQAETQGLSRKQLLEYRATQLGVSDQAAQYIAKLKEQTSATAALGAGQKMTAQQTVQLGAQLQDFFVQVQAGQSPLTAAIQQGSQLSYIFGSFRGAISAVASVLTPTRVLIGGTAAVLGAAALASEQLADEQKAFAVALATSNNAIGASQAGLYAYARQAAETGGTVGAAAEAIAQLVATARVAGADLPRFASIATQAQKYLGREVADTVKAFKELGRDPVNASVRLNEEVRFLTSSLIAQIAALQSQGRTTEAASLAQNAYADALKRTTEQARSSLGLIERGWIGVKDAAKGAWDAMLNVGRPQSLREQLEAINKALESAPRRGVNAIEQAQRRDALRDRKEAIEEALRLEARGNAAAAEQSRQNDEQLAAQSQARQAAEATVGRAQASAELAVLKAGLEDKRRARQIQFARDEIDARTFHDELLRIDTGAINAEIANVERLRKVELSRAPKSVEDERAQRAALLQLDTQRVELQQRLNQLRADEALGLRDIAPKSRSIGAADELRRFKAEDEANVERYFDTVRAKQGELTAATAAYVAALQGESAIRDAQQKAQLAGLALSDRERESYVRLTAAEADYADKLRRLQDERRANKLSPEDYERRLAALDEYHAAALDREARYQEELAAMQADASAGVSRALKNYVDLSGSAARSAEEAFNRGIHSTEDALVQMAATGKANFRSLVSTVIAEALRLRAIRPLLASLARALGGAGNGAPSGGGAVFQEDSISGQRAGGGDVDAGRTYVVGERGPELLRMGSRGGTVVTNDAIGGDIVINNYAGVDVQPRRTSNGGTEIDIRRVSSSAIAGDILSGRGEAGRAMQSQYGANRANGTRRRG